MQYKLTDIKGLGPKTLKKLYQLNIYNPYQLVSFFPKGYNNYYLKETISHLDHGDVITIKTMVISEASLNKYARIPMVIFNVLISNNVVEVVAFNQPYLVNSLKVDEEIILTGKYNFNKNQIVANKIIKPTNYQKITPKYNLEQISDNQYLKLVESVFVNNLVEIYENIPSSIIRKYGLIGRKEAFYNLHLPKDKESISKAIKRLKYEEAYLFQKEFYNKINVKAPKQPVDYNLSLVKELIDKLPFELTSDQKQVVNDIFKDFKTPFNTFRLIQGDVGSGKTVVALLAIFGLLTSGKQAAFMAPTELLAIQQYEFFKKYIEPVYPVYLLTGSSKNHLAIKKVLEEDKPCLLVGTHALASDDVVFNNLSLIIIDEQHKFGVNIRKKLASKGNADLIYLTATPIPRTLAITIFGEAAISSIKEKPKNRKDVLTEYVNDENINLIIDEITKNIYKKEKTFIVVPAIQSDHAKYNINNVYELLEKYQLTKYVEKLHGELTLEQKSNAIDNFTKGNALILLATSMVEVGIDISDATLMIIFSADYFGLSQLHQLRGRVGRSNLDSKCLLVGIKTEQERLEVLTKTNDGFLLSEYDLKLRGPGALLGLEQSGNLQFKYLDFIIDFEILQQMYAEINK